MNALSRWKTEIDVDRIPRPRITRPFLCHSFFFFPFAAKTTQNDHGLSRKRSPYQTDKRSDPRKRR